MTFSLSLLVTVAVATTLSPVCCVASAFSHVRCCINILFLAAGFFWTAEAGSAAGFFWTPRAGSTTICHNSLLQKLPVATGTTAGGGLADDIEPGEKVVVCSCTVWANMAKEVVVGCWSVVRV